MRLPSTTLILILLVGFASDAVAQASDATDYVRLDEAEEIRFARSAAPDVVSADATIWVLRDGEYTVAFRGTNGTQCIVGRSQPKSLEPICYDEEAAATILPWEFKFIELRRRGVNKEDQERILAELVGSGALPMPDRMAVAYMMSSAQRLYDPESGRFAGNWKPHVMIYSPYLTRTDVGFNNNLPTFQVTRPGTPMAYMIVVVPDFVDPK